MTAGYGRNQVNQMIAVAKNISDFYSGLPDAKKFEKTMKAFQYLTKLNLITDSFSNYKLFKELYKDSNSIVGELDRGAFSKKRKIAF